MPYRKIRRLEWNINSFLFFFFPQWTQLKETRIFFERVKYSWNALYNQSKKKKKNEISDTCCRICVCAYLFKYVLLRMKKERRGWRLVFLRSFTEASSMATNDHDERKDRWKDACELWWVIIFIYDNFSETRDKWD